MKTMDAWDRIPESKDRINHDHKRWKKKDKGMITDDYQESMREDMRGPMEGMEAVVPKQASKVQGF